MPKRISESEFEAIMQAIEQNSDGALIEDINHALKEPINRRTLQRRIAVLVDRNQIEIEGRGKATRYRKVPGNVIKVGSIRETETLSSKRRSRESMKINAKHWGQYQCL